MLIARNVAALLGTICLGSGLLFGEDCNHNGVDDAQDISTGASADCNGNGIPDDCDLTQVIQEDFNSEPGSGYVLHGTAQVAENALKLTQSTPNGRGWGGFTQGFGTTPTGWRMSFDFRITGGTADHVTMRLFDADIFNPDSGPQSSSPWLVLDFDHWYNPPTSDGGNDPNDNHIELIFYGAAGAYSWLYTPSFDLENGLWNRVAVDCVGGVVTVWVSAPGQPAEAAFSGIALPEASPEASHLQFEAWGGSLYADHWVDNVLVADLGTTLYDCDSNGLLDVCEIATNPGLDQDANGVLDACQCVATNYCQPTPNSTGSVAKMGFAGQMGVASNNFSLTASGATPLSFGIFFYGANQTQTPLGNGSLCVALDVQRIQPPVLTDQQGRALLPVDLTAPGFASGPFALTPFSTWNFQFWYRDPAGGGAGFNLSDGLEVTFCP